MTSAHSIPTEQYPLIVAKTSKPSSSAFCLVITIQAAAPSEIWLALPAVTIPFSSKTGFNLANDSRLELGLTPSSLSKLPFSWSILM